MSVFGWPEQRCVEPAVYYYRFDDVRYSNGVDQFDNPLPGYTLKVELLKTRVHHFTPKGARLENGVFVLNSATKRYAYETVDLAKESFIARKKRLIQIHQSRINQAEQALKLIDKQLNFVVFP